MITHIFKEEQKFEEENSMKDLDKIELNFEDYKKNDNTVI
jgi:hypothetical protein